MGSQNKSNQNKARHRARKEKKGLVGRESGSVGVGQAGRGGGTREDSRIQVVKIHYIYACKYHHNETSVHNKYLLLTIKAEIKKIRCTIKETKIVI